jgi:hypothetical protein
MEHETLIKIAVGWLLNKKKYPIVASEMVTSNREVPDVIGFSDSSIVIEAKISVSDFRADQKKFFRGVGMGMGVFRYYIVPVEIQDKVLPIMPDKWGLLVVTSRRKVVVQKKSEVHDADKNAEIWFLQSVIRRIAMSAKALKGINVRCYTVQSSTPPKAELHVVPQSVVSSI